MMSLQEVSSTAHFANISQEAPSTNCSATPFQACSNQSINHSQTTIDNARRVKVAALVATVCCLLSVGAVVGFIQLKGWKARESNIKDGTIHFDNKIQANAQSSGYQLQGRSLIQKFIHNIY